MEAKLTVAAIAEAAAVKFSVTCSWWFPYSEERLLGLDGHELTALKYLDK